MSENTLYYGDNLDILQRYIAAESVDLVYLDPPFNSNASYNVLYAEHDGTQAAAQVQAFEDTWRWDTKAADTYQQIVEGGGKVSLVMQAFRTFLGESNMMAYLSMMAPRLVELRRVLKPSGSIYLHCDPTASHHLKLLMDAIFSPAYFGNEIIWQRTRVAKRQSSFFGKVHDVILLYSKSASAVFNSQFLEHPESYKKSHYNLIEPDTGRHYGLWDFTQKGVGPSRRFGYIELSPPAGKHWIWSQERIDKGMKEGLIVFTSKGTPRLKRYLDESEGEHVQDIWIDIFDINAVAHERLGYPTQKPLALLERIIKASSNEGDVVLDPFCGCGTTIVAAQALNRKWIGIDITHIAINLMKNRLMTEFGADTRYKVVGEPQALPDAEELAATNPYQFQWWALGLVKARPADQKKGSDKGIDGRLFFHDEADTSKTKQVIFSVKAGHTNVAHVRDLRGVVERENAQIGVLISLQEPTSHMRREAASSGFYESKALSKRYPRIQILTIAELLDGRVVDMPPMGLNITLSRNLKPKGSKKDNGMEEMV